MQRTWCTTSATAGVASLALLSLTSVSAFPVTAGAAEPPHESRREEEIDEVVVTASPLEVSADQLAAPVTILDRDHVLDHLGATLGETLAQEPGITTSSFAAGASRPVVRGRDGFRVRVLENGIGTHDVSAISADHGVPVNPLTAQRVEVLRGPATLRYGGGAIAGVVNALTGRVPAERGAPLHGELYAGYDTGSRGRDAALLLEGSRGPLAFHLDVLTRDAQAYDIPDTEGKQEFTDTDGWSGALGFAWIGDAGRFGAAYARFANEYGIPAPADPDEPVAIDLDKKSWSFEGDLFAPLAGIDALRFRGSYSDYDHDEVAGGSAVSGFDNDEWEGRLELLHEPLAGMTGALGLHHRHRNLSARGEGRELLAPSGTDMLAGYVYEAFDVSPALTLELGARVESSRVDGAGADGRRRRRDFLPLSGSLGAVWNASDALTLGVTLAATQRAPEALELFAMGPHEADGTFQIGDPAFDEETAYDVEVTLRGAWQRVSFEASAFYTRYQDFIFGRLTGASFDEDGTRFAGDAGELDELLYTQEAAHFYGGELEGRVELFEWLGGRVGVDAQLDYVRGKLDDGNLPRVPPLRWGVAAFFAGERVRARLGVLRTETQDREGPLETATGGYTFVNGSLAVRVYGDEDGTPVDLELAVRNLFDERARNHVSFKVDDVLLPGRTARIGVRARF